MNSFAKIGSEKERVYKTLLSGKVVTLNPKEHVHIDIQEAEVGFICLGISFKESEFMPEGAMQLNDLNNLVLLTVFNANIKKIVNEKPIFIGYIGDKEIYVDLVIELIGKTRRSIDYVVYEGIEE